METEASATAPIAVVEDTKWSAAVASVRRSVIDVIASDALVAGLDVKSLPNRRQDISLAFVDGNDLEVSVDFANVEATLNARHVLEIGFVKIVGNNIAVAANRTEVKELNIILRKGRAFK
jgi:hypothetical protein